MRVDLVLILALAGLALTGCAHRDDPEPEPRIPTAAEVGLGTAGLQRNTLPATNLRMAIEALPSERKLKTGQALGKYQKAGSELPWAVIYEGLTEGRAHFTAGAVSPDKTLLRDEQYLHAPGPDPLVIDGVRIVVHRATRDAAWVTVTPN